MKQAVSFVLGTVFLILGLIGLALPVIPQIPFLLLAAWFFSISSKRFRKWVVSSEWYHKYARQHVKKYSFLRKTFEQDENVEPEYPDEAENADAEGEETPEPEITTEER